MLRRRLRWRRPQLWGARILVWARSPRVAVGWATLFLLAVFGSFQGAGGRRSSCPRNPRPSSDMGVERRGVREGSGGAAVGGGGGGNRGARRYLCGNSLLMAFSWAPSRSRSRGASRLVWKSILIHSAT